MTSSWRCSSSSVLGVMVLSAFVLLFPPCLNAQTDEGLDARLFFAINGWQNPNRYGAFEFIDDASIPMFVGIPLGMTAYGGFARQHDTFSTGLLMGISQLVSLGGTVALKSAVGRERPYETFSSVQVKHLWSAGGYSFPSGHTAQAFAMATIVSLQYPNAITISASMVWALAVGTGRIYLGLHYPSDVLGGMLLGATSALLAWQFRHVVEEFSTKTLGTQASSALALLPSNRANFELGSFRIPLN